jgi:hypothetical protein
MKNLKNVSAILFFIALFVSSFQLIAQCNRLFKHDYVFSIPAASANNGAGEDVEGVITVTQIYHPGQAGDYYTLRIAGVLNGATTGTTFRVRPITLNIQNPDPDNGAFSTSYEDRFQLVGGGSVIFMTVIYHLTSRGGNDPIRVEVEAVLDEWRSN